MQQKLPANVMVDLMEEDLGMRREKRSEEREEFEWKREDRKETHEGIVGLAMNSVVFVMLLSALWSNAGGQQYLITVVTMATLLGLIGTVNAIIGVCKRGGRSSLAWVGLAIGLILLAMLPSAWDYAFSSGSSGEVSKVWPIK
ncbi:MAG: hypothetical protein ISQ14_00530 [Verrucomicrobiae bacterium]|nr:hypothetical protein [Verrucomicrobiae bacterium]